MHLAREDCEYEIQIEAGEKQNGCTLFSAGGRVAECSCGFMRCVYVDGSEGMPALAECQLTTSLSHCD